MIEYTDGQFGSIAPAKDIIDMLNKMPTLDNIKAVHMGSYKELMDVRLGRRDTNSILQEIDEMKKQLEALLPKGMIKTYTIEDIPK